MSVRLLRPASLLLALSAACASPAPGAQDAAAVPPPVTVLDSGSGLPTAPGTGSGAADAASDPGVAPGAGGVDAATAFDATVHPGHEAGLDGGAGPTLDAGVPGPDGTVEAGPALDATVDPPSGERLAFPGAQGFGRLAEGGRGGEVYIVTNLDDDGPGSLRDAIREPHRTVVFEVGGVIRIRERLVFQHHQTIAGQTAPGGGITVYGNGTSFSNASHTIVRYVRFRMGRVGTSEKDTVTMAHGHDVIWDHCSLSWGRDANFDLNRSSGEELENLTLQDSIVAQGLQTHSTGGLINTSATSVIRSLWIDNNSRNPKARGTLQFVNNVLYNWVVSGYILGDTSGRSDGAMIGNYLIAGPETRGGTLNSPTEAYHIHAVGNWYDSNKNGVLDGRLLGEGDFGTATWETSPSTDFPDVPALSAEEALAHVRAHAGTSHFRDAADQYVLDELDSLGTRGATISDEASLGLDGVVGGIPGGTAPADADRDGMADEWERAAGLDPADPEDRNGDRDGDGFTNLEEYVNSRVP